MVHRTRRVRRSVAATNPLNRRLRIESLEERRLLATIPVTTELDIVNGDDGVTSLREAVAQANASAGHDVIAFAPSLAGKPVILLSGQLTITDTVTIQGLSADLTTVNGLNGSRLFDLTSTAGDVTFDGLTLTGGRTTGSNSSHQDTTHSGSAIRSLTSGNLTLSQSTVSGNSTTGEYSRGGGVFAVSSVTLIQSTVSGNSTTGQQSYGGGIHAGGSVTLTQSTVSGNSTTGHYSRGGGISASGTVTLTQSTVSGNRTTGGAASGGGMYTNSVTLTQSTISENSSAGSRSHGGGISASGTVTLTQSTVSGNSTTGYYSKGGGIFTNGSVTLTQSTISGNSTVGSYSYGGGISVYLEVPIVINGSIIASNAAAAGYTDLKLGTGALTVSYSLIGNTSGSGITAGTGVGNLLNVAPLLAPLANNGGPTLTHALLAGSPAIDAGNNGLAVDPVAQTALTTDQRGAPFARIVANDGLDGAVVDMGAYERQTLPSSMFVVDTLTDENDGDYSVGDRSLRELIGLVKVSVGVETITFAPALTSGGPAVMLLTRGELVIGDSLTIEGPGANLLTIDASGNDPTPDTNNGDGSRVFNIDDGNHAPDKNVSISGLTLTGGDANYHGGAIFTAGNLTLTSSTISGNSTTRDGGGIILTGTGNATIVDSKITGNSALSGGGVASYRGNLTLNASTISNNLATNGRGGGIFSNRGNLTVIGSTISGNTATLDGGGIVFYFYDASIVDSTISGNVANRDGGGIWSHVNPFFPQSTTILNSTLSGNAASGRGGGVFNSQGSTSIRQSTITGNTAPAGSGGGVASPGIQYFARTEAHSSIIAGNTSSDVDFGPGTFNTFQSLGYNLIGAGNSLASFNQPGDQTSANPLLGPLASNGGPTRTHALLAGSPAIDAGDPAALAGVGETPLYDQRGIAFGRVVGGRIDIGALETGTATSADFDADGDVDGADFLTWQRGYGGSSVVHADGDADRDRDVDDHDLAAWAADFGKRGPAGIAVALVAAIEAEVHPASSLNRLTPRDVFSSPATQKVNEQGARTGAGVVIDAPSHSFAPDWRSALAGKSPHDFEDIAVSRRNKGAEQWLNHEFAECVWSTWEEW